MKPINILFWIFFFVLGLLIGCKSCCKKCYSTIEIKQNTTDTVIIIQPGERSEIIQPELANKKRDKVFPFVPVPEPEIPAPSGNYDSLLQEYTALEATLKEVWRQFDEQKNYTQTFRFKNGVVGLSASVLQNNLFNLQATLDSVQQTVITNTVYERERKRNQLYLSMGGIYNSNALSVGGGLLFKTKRDRMYQAGAYIGTDGRISYRGGMSFKLSFRKP